MSAVAQLIPLSEADRLILTQKRNKQLLLIPAVAFASLVSLLLIGVIQTCFSTVFFLIIALSMAAKAVHSLARAISLSRDLSAGQKRVIRAPVEDQNMDVSRRIRYGGSEGAASYVFWIKAGGYKLPVTEEHYYKIKKGDLVEAYLAPNSGTVLGVSDRSTGEPALASNVAAPLPSARARSNLAVTSILGGIGLVFVLAVGALFWMNLSQSTRNTLNPFGARPLKGAFPATIAGFTRTHGPNYEHESFSASYKKADQTVSYVVVEGTYDTMYRLHPHYYLRGDSRIVEDTDTRTVSLNSKDENNTIVLVFGTRLIEISSYSLPDLIDFENGLPYAAFGVSTPPHHSVAEIKEKPILASTFLEEFSKDKAAATKKYQGQTLLFSGTVAAVSHSKDGKPLLALQKPGTTVSASTILSCSFKPSEDTKVSALKNGQEIQLRGRVNSVFGVLLIEDCELASDGSTPSAASATNASTTLSLERGSEAKHSF